MESTLTKIKQNQFDLTVELNADDLLRYVSNAENSLAQGLIIDGFRKGKVPPNIIKEKIGEQGILEAALDIALRDSLAKTIAEKELDVMDVSKLDIKENSKSKLVYKTTVSLFPPVAIGDLSGLKIERKHVHVNDEELSDALETIVESRATYDDKDSPVGSGDRVEADFEVTKNGQAIDGGISKNHPIVIGSKHFMPGFEEALIGLKKGEDKKFSLVAPDNYFEKSIAGQKLDFTVKVNNIQKMKKPELSDEFAKSLGKFEGLDDLKKNIKNGLLEEKKEKEGQRVRLEILGKIADLSKVEVPDSMTDKRLDSMIDNFDEDLHKKGMELSLYLAHINKNQDDLRKDWRKDAERQVTFSLLLRKLAKDKGIIASEEEIDEMTAQKVQAISLYGQVDKDSIDIQAVRQSAADQIVSEKILTYLEETYSA